MYIYTFHLQILKIKPRLAPDEVLGDGHPYVWPVLSEFSNLRVKKLTLRKLTLRIYASHNDLNLNAVSELRSGEDEISSDEG